MKKGILGRRTVPRPCSLALIGFPWSFLSWAQRRMVPKDEAVLLAAACAFENLCTELGVHCLWSPARAPAAGNSGGSSGPEACRGQA